MLVIVLVVRFFLSYFSHSYGNDLSIWGDIVLLETATDCLTGAAAKQRFHNPRCIDLGVYRAITRLSPLHMAVSATKIPMMHSYLPALYNTFIYPHICCMALTQCYQSVYAIDYVCLKKVPLLQRGSPVIHPSDSQPRRVGFKLQNLKSTCVQVSFSSVSYTLQKELVSQIHPESNSADSPG